MSAEELATQTEPTVDGTSEPSEGGFWRRTSRFLTELGVTAGQAAATGYQAIDPDVRRHFGGLPLMALTALSLNGDSTPRALADDRHRPLVYVHGLAGAGSNFIALRTALALRGRRRTYAIKFQRTQSLETLAGDLALYLRQVIGVNQLGDSAQLDVVAHSMGGVVARLALEDPALRGRIATLITLGSPHSGTYLARFANTTVTRSLRPDSEQIARLDRQLPWPGLPDMPRLVALWSDADMMRLPHDAARVDGAENVLMSGFTHYDYLIRPEGWRMVAKALGM